MDSSIYLEENSLKKLLLIAILVIFTIIKIVFELFKSISEMADVLYPYEVYDYKDIYGEAKRDD